MNIQRMSTSTSLHRNYVNTDETSPSPMLYSSIITSSSNINMPHPSTLFHSDSFNYHPDHINPAITSLSGDSFDVENLHTLLDLLDDPPHNLEYFSEDIPNNVDEIIKRSGVSSIATVPNIIDLDWQSNIEEMKRNSNNSHKQRIRWTTELHDLFLDAIQTLGGPEFATPKKILGIMNVKGLNIYHVKSHLQKYRLAKNNVPDLTHERKDCTSSTENKETYHKNDNINSSDNMPVTEALRMQIELQKLLHDQLKAHRDLQVSIEQNAEFLRKLIEKQNNQKTKADDHSSSSPIIINDLSDSN